MAGQKIVIPCEVTIKPGDGTIQNHIQISTNGETAFDGYEDSLSDGMREFGYELSAAQARLLNKYAERLAG